MAVSLLPELALSRALALLANAILAVLSDLADDIRRFITAHITSVLQLEALLLMRSEREREWTAEEVSRSLYATVSGMANKLFDLEAKGLLVRGEAANTSFRYRPTTDEMDAIVGRLADLYKERRVAVISFIYSEPVDKAQSFADAFRIRKDQEP